MVFISKFGVLELLAYSFRFSDITHEVKPVISGRRLVLTYNLVHTTPESKELVANLTKRAKLRDLLSWWKRKSM
jgi:hypothetical protein